MEKQAVVTLVSSFIGGIGMTFLKGFKWFGDPAVVVVSVLGGVLATWMTEQHPTPAMWAFWIMTHTLTVFGAVHVADMAAKGRANLNLPAAMLPQNNELSGK